MATRRLPREPCARVRGTMEGACPHHTMPRSLSVARAVRGRGMQHASASVVFWGSARRLRRCGGAAQYDRQAEQSRQGVVKGV